MDNAVHNAHKTEFEVDPVFERIVAILKVLSNPLRLKMAHLMCEREVCNSDFEWIFDKHQTLISHHIKEFKNAHLVNERRVGKFRKYSIDDAQLKAILSALVDTGL